MPWLILVNTVGVMGKGIALQFKKTFPEMFEACRKAAKNSEIRLGEVQVWETGQVTGPKYVINFPTKGHWKSRAQLKDIESGLVDLVKVVRELGIASIAVPPLGCGNGGLDWLEVQPRILQAFASSPEVSVLLFTPEGAPAAADIVTNTKRPTMTPGRAALVEIVHRYTQQSFVAPGLVECQKLMYFLQAAGEPLRLNFSADRCGPYAANLRHVLSHVEGHFLSGYGDGSATVAEAEPLTVLPGAVVEAQSMLESRLETVARIDRVLSLAAGFESPYGLELLSTVHWWETQSVSRDQSELARRMWEWSPRKARMFTADHVQTASNALRAQGWLPVAAVA